MSQQQDIEQRGPAGLPIAKLRTIGETFIGALVDAETRQQVKWKDNKPDGPAFKKDGVTPAMERILYVLVQPGTTAERGDDDAPSGYAPLEVGTLARVILKGFKWGQYIDARNADFGIKGEKTGDIITIAYTHASYTHPRTGARIELYTEADIDQVHRDIVIGKDWSVQVARPGPHQDAVIDACNEARAARKTQDIGDEVGPGPAPAAAPTVASSGWLVGGAQSTAEQLARATPLQRQAFTNAANSEPPF